MFGINNKKYFVFSIGLCVIGIAILVLMLVNVFPKDRLIVLSAVAILLLSLCVFIQPYNKKLKIVTELMKKYRPELYNELGKYNQEFDKIVVKENEQGKLYLDLQKRIVFDDLNKQEAEYILLRLMKDYVIIMYSVYESNKLNLKKLSIESFTLVFKYRDNVVKEIKIASDYTVLKIK